MKFSFKIILVFFVLLVSANIKSNAQCSATAALTGSYCGSGDAIDYFELNSIATTGNFGCSSSSGYAFYSTPVRSLNIGSTYSFYAIVGGGSWYEGFAIWIDLNNNGFYESTEMLASTPPSYYHSGTITIPATATPGTNIRMRTKCHYNSQPTSTQMCFVPTYGETEDYYVNLVGGCGATVTAQPVNATICTNNVGSFSVTATGATGGYQWQVNTGSGFTNITNGGVYSGATTASLAVSFPTIGMNGYTYRCAVTNSTGPCTITSNAATLTVQSGNTITGTTGNTTCSGTASSVSATASGGTISWYTAATGGTLLGTGSTYSVSNPTATTTYYAEAGSLVTTNGSLTTIAAPTNGQASAMLDVIPLTNITMTSLVFNPRSTANYVVSIYYKVGTFVGFETNSAAWTLIGTSSSFACVSNTNIQIPITFSLPLTSGQRYAFYIYCNSGGTLGYQSTTSVGNLYASNSDLQAYEGKGMSALFGGTIFSPRTWGGTFNYTKSVAGCPSIRSAATLTVNGAPTVTTHPSDVTGVCPGSNASFTVAASGTGLVYQWQYSTDGGVTYNDLINTPPYSNVTTSTMNITNIPSGYNNYKYRCSLSGTCPGTSNSNAGTLTFITAPPVTTQPSSITICPAGNATFTAAATGTGLTYQWQESTNSGASWSNLSNGGVYSNVTTATLSLTGVPGTMHLNQYRCVITNCAAFSLTNGGGIKYQSIITN